MTAQLVLLLGLIALLDFATPVIPVGHAFEWEDEEEATHVRRPDSRRRLTRVSPAPSPCCSNQLQASRLTAPTAPDGNPPRERRSPDKRPRPDSTTLASPPEDH